MRRIAKWLITRGAARGCTRKSRRCREVVDTESGMLNLVVMWMGRCVVIEMWQCDAIRDSERQSPMWACLGRGTTFSSFLESPEGRA